MDNAQTFAASVWLSIRALKIVNMETGGRRETAA
jgi:hypothetical protein